MIGISQFYKVPIPHIAYGYTKKKYSTQKQQKISPLLFAKNELTSSLIYWTNATSSTFHREQTALSGPELGLNQPTQLTETELDGVCSAN